LKRKEIWLGKPVSGNLVKTGRSAGKLPTTSLKGGLISKCKPGLRKKQPAKEPKHIAAEGEPGNHKKDKKIKKKENQGTAIS